MRILYSLLFVLTLLISEEKVYATFMEVLETGKIFPLELNDNGLVIGKYLEEIKGPSHTSWSVGDKGNLVQFTHYGPSTYKYNLTFWNFTPATFPNKKLGEGNIYMNSSNVMAIEHVTAVIDHPDNTTEQFLQSLIFYPDATFKKLKLISEVDKIQYLDDNGDVVIKNIENGKELYYSQNVYDLGEINYLDIDVNSSDFKEILKYHQDKFKGVKNKNLLDFKDLNQKITDYFVRTKKMTSSNSSSSYTPQNWGWNIQEIILASGNGHYVAKANYVPYWAFDDWDGIRFWHHDVYHIYIDVNRE